MFVTKGETIKYESFPLEKGKKIIIYLSKKNGLFFEDSKCFGSHYLEQVFDDNGNIIEENIKINPHHTNLNVPNQDINFD